MTYKLAFDFKSIPYATATVTSIRMQNGICPLEILVGVSDDHEESLLASELRKFPCYEYATVIPVRLSQICEDPAFLGYVRSGRETHINSWAFLRFLCFVVGTTDDFTYLDFDTLVVNAAPSFSDHGIQVTNQPWGLMPTPHLPENEWGRKWYSFAQPFNTGFFRYRARNSEEPKKIFRESQEFLRTKMSECHTWNGESDCLFHALRSQDVRIFYLPLSYNMMLGYYDDVAGVEERISGYENAMRGENYIIHFTGRIKPWHPCTDLHPIHMKWRDLWNCYKNVAEDNA